MNKVDGWDTPAYLAAGARSPRSIGGASLLSPFDPMVWFRPRGLRIFDFHYRIEIYVPEAKRKWGYYVLPFRIGDEMRRRYDDMSPEERDAFKQKRREHGDRGQRSRNHDRKQRDTSEQL